MTRQAWLNQAIARKQAVIILKNCAPTNLLEAKCL